MSLRPEVNKETEVAKGFGSESHFPVSYIAVLAGVVFAGAILTGIILLKNYRTTLNRTQILLTRISEDTARSIDEWVQTTAKQAMVMASFPAVAEATSSSDPKVIAHASAVLELVRTPFDYTAIYAVDRNGVSKAHTADSPPLSPWLREEATKPSGPQTLTCFEPGLNPGFPQLAFLVPIERGNFEGGRRERIGTLVVLTRRSALPPLAEPQGANSDVRSVLFARSPQGGIVYFSHIFHPPPAGGSWRDEAAEAALRGEVIFTLRTTGDGLPQYVVTRRLPELGWGMVTRQWQASVLATFWRTVAFSVLIFLVCSALLVTCVVAIWRHQQVLRLQEEMQARAKTEKELRQSQELFNKSFHSCPEGMSLSRIRDGCFVEVNDAFLATSGYSREDLIGHSSLNLDFWSDPRDREKLIQALRHGEQVRSWRVRGRTKHGSTVEVQLSADVVQIQDEKCLLLIMRDITSQLALEEQVRQAQKMEAVGLLAGAVAHDFNNLLMAISSQAELLLDAAGPGSVEQRTRKILSATESAAKLTRKLLAFGRKQELASSAFDLNQLVLETADLIQHMTPPAIAMDVRLASSPCWVQADRAQIELTIINMVLNARDAMPDGGKLVISTAPLAITGKDQDSHGGVPAGDYILISFADTGHGIPEQNINRIFEPFFTTKPEGRGTGLGLSIVYGIIRQSGGHVRVRSTVGAGTTFLIYLPSVPQPYPDPPPFHPCPLGKYGGSCPREGTILVVDDEEQVRASVQAFRGNCGVTVLDCANASEALRVSSGLKDSLVLLVTDIAMPGMSGMELAQALVQQIPDLPILFMSGYAVAGNGHQQFRHAKFLQKPFTRAELMNSLCAELETCPFKRIQV